MKVTGAEIDPVGPVAAITLSYKDPQTLNPFNVKNIIGLDADSIVSRYYGQHGDSKFYRLSIEQRDLIVRVGLNPRFHLGESYSGLRDQLYKTIAASRNGTVALNFLNGADVVASVKGFVTRVEAAQFERTQEVQLTIRADDPMLRQPTPVEVPLAGQFSNNFLVQDDLSTAPHGLYLQMKVTTATPTLNLTDPFADSWSFVVSPQGGFLVNDVIEVSSEHNNKILQVVRGATTVYLADAILLGSNWPLVFPGENRYAIGLNPNRFTLQKIEHRPTYWGV